MRTPVFVLMVCLSAIASAKQRPPAIDRAEVEAAANAAKADLKARCGCNVNIAPDYAGITEKVPGAFQPTGQITGTINAFRELGKFLCKDESAKAKLCSTVQTLAVTPAGEGDGGGNCTITKPGVFSCTIQQGYAAGDMMEEALNIHRAPYSEPTESPEATTSPTPAEPTGSCTVFETATLKIPDSSPVRELATADFNGDGVADIAAGLETLTGTPAAFGGGHVLVFLSEGPGKFRAGVPYNVPGKDERQMRLSAGDLDGDGKADLVAYHVSGQSVSHPDRTVLVLMNNGKGVFKTLAHVDLGVDEFAHLRIGDVDGDRKGDLVVGAEYPTRDTFVLRGDGKGGFAKGVPVKLTEEKESVSLADGRIWWDVRDIDGDGKAEMVVTPRAFAKLVGEREDSAGDRGVCTIAFTTNPPTSACFSSREAFEPKSGLIADIDGDGKADVISGPEQSSYTNAPSYGFLRSTGKAQLAERRMFGDGHASHFIDFGAIDGDGDGHIDVVTYGSVAGGMGLTLFRNDGKGRFTSYAETSGGPEAIWWREPSALAFDSFGGRGALGVALYHWSRDENLVHVFAGKCAK